jgi:hypothetical protein
MRRFRLVATVFLVPVLTYLVATLGCSSGDNKPGSSGGPGPGNTGQPPGGTGKPKAVEAKDFATIKGKVTYDGDPPNPGTVTDREDFKKNEDKEKCEANPDDLKGQAWKVSADKGVANVVVWVRPPQGTYFPVPKNVTWNKNATIDQPFCAFHPHVLVLFPADAEGNKSGQTFTVLNSSKDITHNTKWAGGPKNPGDNKNIPPGGKIPVELQVDRVPVKIQCDRHKWMDAFAWVLDSPYAAVTDKEGNFEIKEVPAGVKLSLVGWHEPDQFALPSANPSNKGEDIGELKAGETKEVNFKVKAK